MEVKNRLLKFNKAIYQDDEWFKFSIDSVLLVNFVTLNLRCRNIMDLCTGNAVIPLLLSSKTKSMIDCIEIQKCIYDLGVKSINYNGLLKQINIFNVDIKEVSKYFDSEKYDTVICNPPYFKTINSEFYNNNKIKSIARHEIMLELEDVFKSAKYLLRNGGNFAMVHRCERLVEILNLLSKYNLEPKKIQFIYSYKKKNSELFLIEAKKNGKSGLKIIPDLIIYNDDGSYTKDVKKMFG